MINEMNDPRLRRLEDANGFSYWVPIYYKITEIYNQHHLCLLSLAIINSEGNVLKSRWANVDRSIELSTLTNLTVREPYDEKLGDLL